MLVKGFTVLELIITLALLAMLVSISAPHFSSFISKYKTTSRLNHFLAAIALTRSEAIKRNQRVTICQSSNSINCTKDSDKWHEGWVIFVDDNENNKIDVNETVIRMQQQAITDITISFGARTRIAYKPSGIAVGGSNGTLLFCSDGRKSNPKGLIISITGRVRKANGSDLISKTCPG